jgi:DNA helicase HerA-like ATPase
MNDKIQGRMDKVGIPYKLHASPVEFLTLSNEKGTRLRATVTEFGPVLFSKILELNDVQQGVVSLIFKYCDDNRLPLLDLSDFKKTLQFLTNEGKASIQQDYGSISSASTGTIMRKILELEQQDAELFFGEPSFEVDELLRKDAQGQGMVSIMRLVDIQDKPKLFSTFMLQLLAEVYATFPEVGDLDKPKLTIFIDEAHLIFDSATQTLLNQIETTIKLIRSKGVGIFFITQNPSDVPNSILGQLGLKIQHALRAFTAKDRKDIKLTSENFPLSKFYVIDQVLTNMGIGEAFVTGLNDKGIPTPLAYTMLRAPESRMDVLTEDEINYIAFNSKIISKYNKTIDRESAYEILNDKIEQFNNSKQEVAADKPAPRGRQEKTIFEEVISNTTTRQVLRTVAREATRGLLGVFGLGGKSTKKSGWF